MTCETGHMTWDMLHVTSDTRPMTSDYGFFLILNIYDLRYSVSPACMIFVYQTWPNTRATLQTPLYQGVTNNSVFKH